MIQELQDRTSRKQEEERNVLITNKIKAEKEKKMAKFNEPALREQFKQELLNDTEKQLAALRIRITPSIYDDLYRFFDFMKHNVNEKNQSKCYMTEASIKQNLSKYFGHKTTLLDSRFYNILTDG